MKTKILIKIRMCAVLLILLLLSLLVLFGSSCCERELKFGELAIYEKNEGASFEPAGSKSNLGINVKKVYAVIEVSGARTEDNWKFVWINEDTGKVIAESEGKYSEDDTGYIEGFISSCLTPNEKTGIIGEPGKYRVDFYHNGQLMSTAYFAINSPGMKITEVILSAKIDDAGRPDGISEIFYPDDTIYAFVGLNCRIAGETLGVKWYRGEDHLLGEEEYNIEKNYYLPDFIIFKITNDELWPAGDYRVEVYHNELLEGEYYFEIIKKVIPDAAFNKSNKYKKDEYKLSVVYPDLWDFEETEDSSGLEVNFTPLSEDINAAVYIRVLKKGYYPPEEEYADFAGKILGELVDLNDGLEVESGEETVEINGITGRQFKYYYSENDKDGWDIEMTFIAKNNMLYLLIKFSDIYYREFSDRLYGIMLNSLSPE